MVLEVGESGNRAPGLWGFLAGEGCQRCQESTVGIVPGEHGRVQCQESTVGLVPGEHGRFCARRAQYRC